ncbi:NAD(P)-binding protein [Tothia fuscella]|uniref:NAD(P)-binding protein n=1 Tax=Tothia fuscella TaxID=1048955 RepID=A0A9P4TWT8_9PEZI|nr:NAD(P)-binding protein [Tothia fuscella]
MAPSVLVIGGSGFMGTPVVEELLSKKDQFGKIGILADPSRADKFDAIKSRGVNIVKGSYLDSRCYAGYDTVLSLVGNALMKIQPGIIEAAVTGGVTHFYPSEFGADLSMPELRNVRYFRDKYATRETLVEKAKEVSGFRYTLLMSGSFTEFSASEFFGVDTVKHTVDTFGKPDAMITNTAHLDVVKYLAASILLPFKSADPKREIRVAGGRQTWQQLMDLLAEIQGVQYTINYQSPKPAIENEKAAFVVGDVNAQLAWSAKPLAASGLSNLDSLDNDFFDFVPETPRETFTKMFGKKEK